MLISINGLKKPGAISNYALFDLYSQLLLILINAHQLEFLYLRS
jgi:hypothetical protein